MYIYTPMAGLWEFKYQKISKKLKSAKSMKIVSAIIYSFLKI